jgi:uncharacterized protein YbjT (DUF2867 family)
MSTIFVTGATGLTGANVCQQLIERGDDVRALVRNPAEGGQWVLARPDDLMPLTFSPIV